MNVKVRAIYYKELRDMLRDRRTIFASVVIPIMIYPLLTLGMLEVTLMAKAKLDREEFPVAVLPGTKSTVEKIRKVALETPDPIKGIPGSEDKKKKEPKKAAAADNAPPDEFEVEDPFKSTKFVFKEQSIDTARAELKAGTIRAILLLPVAFESDIETVNEPPPAISIEYDQAERVSQSAASRLRTMLERYDSAVVANRLKDKTLPSHFLHAFTLDSKNTAAAEKVSGSLVGSLLPFLFIMMLLTGALHPAIDLTAGEKERSTLETLVGTPATPLEIISGKFLAVSTLSMANAALNVASFAGSFSVIPMPKGFEFQFPYAALPLTLMLLIPLALFFSAMLLMVSSFAANTKEAQVYCMPVFMIPMSVMAIAMTPGIELAGPLLITPVINTALLIKELFLGHGTMQQILFVLISNCFYAAGMVALASRVFAREEVLFSAQGSLRMFLSRRFFKPSPTPRAGDSLLVAALFFPLYFYGSVYLQKMLIDDPRKGIDSGAFALMLAIPQYVLFLGLPMLIAKYLKANLSTTFQWRMPDMKAILGAFLMGASSWLLVMQIVKWQSYFWQPSEQDKAISDSLNNIANGRFGELLIFLLAAVTPAFCEEHFFRGFFQQGLGRRNKWTAVFLTGAVFAFFHLSPYKMGILFMLGSVISYVAFKTWSIWPGILMHMMHNGLSFFGQTLLFPNAKSEDDIRISIPMLAGAAILFAAGLFIVSRSGPPEHEHDHALKT